MQQPLIDSISQQEMDNLLRHTTGGGLNPTGKR